MRMLPILIGTVLVLAACVGSHFRWEDARKLKPGMTKEEVVALLGQPYSITATDDIVSYIWVEVNSLTFASKSLRIDFRDGKAVKVPPIPEEFK